MSYSATIVRAAEETVARTVWVDPENKADSPDYECVSYLEQKPAVEFVRAVYGGTETAREGKEEFLPQHPMEERQKYEKRVGIGVMFNALKRTVAGLVGMVFRKDPTYVDVPETIVEHFEDIDHQGRRLALFLRDVGTDAMIDGHCWIHVDEPTVDPDVIRTRQDAEEVGIRPYWIKVPKLQNRNVRHTFRGGRPVITLFVYDESSNEPDGPFGEKATECRRALREGDFNADGVRGNVTNELWEYIEDERGKLRWHLKESYEIGVRTVPVVCCYGDRVSAYTSRPPLQDIAYEQAEHYRVRSDRQASLTYSSISVPYHFATGAIDHDGTPKVKWGPGGMLLSNDPTAQAGTIESHGYGLEATKEELQEIEARIASLGLQMLVQPGAAQGRNTETTATSTILGKSEGDAALAVFAIGLEDAGTQALCIHGEYMGLAPEQVGKIEVNKDFHEQLIDAALLREAREANLNGQLPIEELWLLMQKGEVLSDLVDFEEMKVRLAAESEARISATQEMLFAEAEAGKDDDEEDEKAEAA